MGARSMERPAFNNRSSSIDMHRSKVNVLVSMHVQYQESFAGVLLPPLETDFPQLIYEVGPELIFFML